MNHVYILSRISRTFLSLLLFLIALNTNGATKTWNNTSGGSWATGSNWTPSGVPATDDDVIIPLFSSASTNIQDIPTITLNSLTFTGTGFSWIRAASSGNVLTLRSSMLVPASSTVLVSTNNERLVMTLSTTCSATLVGSMAYDAGSTNRIFTVNGTLTVMSGGCLYDPNPTGGSDFVLASTGMIRTQKSQGITTTSAPNTAGINFNATISFGGSYTYNSGARYEYFGTAGQITGAGLTQNTPGQLIVNLSAGTLTLSNSTTVSGTITLTSGNVNLNSNTLTLGTSAAAPGTLVRSSGSLFDGTFRRWFTTTAVTVGATSGLFPLGTNTGDYRPLWLGSSSNLTSAGTIAVRHIYAYPATNNTVSYTDASWGFDVKGVSNSSWSITPANSFAFNGSTGAIRYGGEGYGTNTLTDLNASLASSAIGTHGAATNVNVSYEVNRSGLATTSVTTSWFIGTKNRGASALPVELYGFTGTSQNNGVLLTWLTASEKDASHFEIQRTTDGQTINILGNVNAQGNSRSKFEYSFLDEQPFHGLNYYRLKQCDIDGTCKEYPWIALQASSSGEAIISLVPNPADTHIDFKTTGFDPSSIQHLKIQNMRGVTVYESNELPEALEINNLPSGVYILTAQLIQGSITTKLVVSH